MLYIDHMEFERLVSEAVKELPEEFARLVHNVAIVVEDEPSDEDLDVLDDEGELLGIYRGVALPRRTFDMLPHLPDQIAIFRGPILRVSRTRREAIEEVRDTVIHELGHYFGLDDDDMVY